MLTALARDRAGAQKACSFDTAAHTDTLTLELSLRAFRDNDTLPDPVLTRGFGDMIRPRFAAPPTIGQLLYPNTYRPLRGAIGYAATFGTIQFDLTPEGVLKDEKWFAAGPDKGTDDALAAALKRATETSEPRDLALMFGAKKPTRVYLRFVMAQDSSVRAPLARLRAPMVRIDSGGTPVAMARQQTQSMLVPRDMIRTSDQMPITTYEMIIDESGYPLKESVQVVRAPSLDVLGGFISGTLSRQWTPFMAGGCPVSGRIFLRTGKQIK